MKKNKIFLLLLLTIALGGCNTLKNQTKAEKNDWKLSIQSYTFQLFTLVEAIDKTSELGVKYMEVYPGQKLGGIFGDDKFNYNLTAEQRKGIVDYAKSKNVKLISTGVLVPKRDELEKVFAFAKDMKMEFISAEPARDDWELVEELAKRYKIKVATHNHPSEKSYWKPEILMELIGNRSKLLGSSCDVGHFKRMGLDPLECVKQLNGRIISLHFKDLEPEGAKYEDVVWGQGVLNLKKIMLELKKQNYKGYFTIEYEAEWKNNIPSIRKSIEYFNKISNEIL